jgi:hypothetical protein
MTNEATGYRSKDQVLFDLAKALAFSPESLQANRQGRLSADQFKKFMGRCTRPAAMAAAWAVAPFLIWTGMTAARQQVSFGAGFVIFLGNLMHLSDFVAAQGKFSALATVGSTLVCLGLAAYTASRLSMPLYLDAMARQVIAKEGRLLGREEQLLRANGRDPIERYYFSMKTDTYEVNLAAYRAIESGSVYLVYLLPRSGLLVSLEPKITT